MLTVTRNEQVTGFMLKANAFGDTETLKCPVCGYNFIHIMDIRKSKSDDCVEIFMECESQQHEWVRTYEYHKGQVYHYDVILSAIDKTMVEKSAKDYVK